MIRTDRIKRVANGLVEDMHRCPVCCKIRAHDEGAPLVDNGYQLTSVPIVHVRGCPLRAERPAALAG